MTKHSSVKPRRISTSLQRTTSEWVGYLKAPTSKNHRSTFAILKKWKSSGKSETVKSEALDAVNRRFLVKEITQDQARVLVKDLVDQMNGEIRTAILHNEDNYKILDDYWKQEYEHRDLTAPVKAYQRLRRAVEAVGLYNLTTASRHEMQTEINSRYQGNRQRKIVSALNQILSYLGRDKERLRKDRTEIKPVRYLTQKELDTLLSAISDPILVLIYRVAFGTGLRLGEIFAISPEHVFEDHILVTSQIDENGIRRETKTRKIRNALIIGGFEKAVAEWAAYPDKLKYRYFEFSKFTHKITQKYLNKSLTFHDLRHSYAVHLVRHGTSLTNVAQFLGNSVVVCELYYSGFIASPETIAWVKTKLSQS